ncbi:MAG TPA: GntR family transcriptional regulator, partial [Roseibacterium sp.]|nr:GntR family transcriptional regulator [Roseibacterium sp.]
LFHALRSAILLREIQPDEPMKETRIGRDYNCSQGTVREALMRLQEEGLVSRRGYRGTIATRSTLAEAVQMAEIRIKLEVEGIRRTARVVTDKELALFEASLSDMTRAKTDGDDYALSEADRKFHLLIFHCSGLAALEPILRRCMLHMHLQTFGHPPSEITTEYPEVAHRPIFDALHQRDPDRAAVEIAAHINQMIGLGAPQLKSAMDAR